MGLEEVKEEVIRQAKEQETALLAEARMESNRIMKETEKRIEGIKAKNESNTKKMMDFIKRQALANAELENKKLLLETKKQIIENVFAEAKKKIKTLDNQKKEGYIKKLIEKAKKGVDVDHFYCNKKDTRFFKELTSEPIDIIGGLIAENKEKTIRVDYSFETMLEGIKENEMQNINKLLFG